MKLIFLFIFLISFDAHALDPNTCDLGFTSTQAKWIEDEVDNALNGDATVEYELGMSLLEVLKVKIEGNISRFNNCRQLEKHYRYQVGNIFKLIKKVETFQSRL